jgi:hypothetical protein
MTMERGGRAAREREALRAAILTIVAPCLDCPAATMNVEWSVHRGGYVVAVSHMWTCPVRRNDWSRRACDDRLRALIMLAGVNLAEYCDDVTSHR